MNERPQYTKWTRKTGGAKVCPKCRHRHKPVMRVDGKTQRVKTCIRCGAVLPTRLTFPKKYKVLWLVREFLPNTGQSKDIACKTSEAADEFIRLRQRDYTPDPIRVELLEYTSVLIRQINGNFRIELNIA